MSDGPITLCTQALSESARVYTCGVCFLHENALMATSVQDTRKSMCVKHFLLIRTQVIHIFSTIFSPTQRCKKNQQEAQSIKTT